MATHAITNTQTRTCNCSAHLSGIFHRNRSGTFDVLLMRATRHEDTPRHVGLMHTVPLRGSDNLGAQPEPAAYTLRLLSGEWFTSSPSCDWKLRAALGLNRTMSSWKPFASAKNDNRRRLTKELGS